MQPVEHGLWIALGVSMGFAFLAAFGAASNEDNILRGAGSWLLAFVAMTRVMFAVVYFFGGLALLAWQVYRRPEAGRFASTGEGTDQPSHGHQLMCVAIGQRIVGRRQ
jgi:hypothetical protein